MYPYPSTGTLACTSNTSFTTRALSAPNMNSDIRPLRLTSLTQSQPIDKPTHCFLADYSTDPCIDQYFTSMNSSPERHFPSRPSTPANQRTLLSRWPNLPFPDPKFSLNFPLKLCLHTITRSIPQFFPCRFVIQSGPSQLPHLTSLTYNHDPLSINITNSFPNSTSIAANYPNSGLPQDYRQHDK